MIFLYISNLIGTLIFFSCGTALNSFILQNLKKNPDTIIDIFCGIIYLSFIALIINFFYPLNIIINNLILFFFLGLFIFFTIRKNINLYEVLKKILLIGTISFILMTLSSSYTPDAGLYHLPYISILNENKIIIGLSNIHFRFGHSSIIQYTSAIFNNSIFLTKGITLPTGIILSSIILFFIQNFLKNKKDLFFLLLYFLTLIFILIKSSRYNDIGNDIIGNLFYLIIVVFFLELIKNKNKDYSNFFIICLFCIFAFANKIFLAFSFLFPVFYIFLFKNYNFILNFRNTLFVIFLSSLFFKNILISSCIIYPIKELCLKNLIWSAPEKYMHANAQERSIQSEAAAKGWRDLKNSELTRTEFNKDFNWLNTWLNKHFKYIIKKIFPLFFFLILIIILLKRKKPKKILRKIKKNKVLDIAIICSILISFIGFIFWFLKFPLYRYGYAFLISSIILPYCYILYSKFDNSNITKLYSILKKTFIVVLIFMGTINVKRIIVEYQYNYNDFPWPKIYSYDKKNLEQKNYPFLISNSIKIYNPRYRLCMYSKGPCTHYEEIKNEIIAKKSNSYVIIIPKK